MDKGNAGLSTIDTVPDVRGFLGSWDEVSMQISEQSTALSRDALSAALRLFEQSVSDAGEWMQTLGQGTRRLGELAQATERRIGAAEDVAGVWNLELGLLGQSAQMAAAFGQDAWLALARSQTGMLQSALAQGAQSFERVVNAANGLSPDVEEAVAAVPDEPIVPFVHLLPAQWQTQWPAVAESMSQGMQAMWQAMAAAGAAATQAPADAASAVAPLSRPRQASNPRTPGKTNPRARSR